MMSKPIKLNEAKWKIKIKQISTIFSYYYTLTPKTNALKDMEVDYLLSKNYPTKRKAINAGIRFCKLNGWKYEAVE